MAEYYRFYQDSYMKSVDVINIVKEEIKKAKELMEAALNEKDAALLAREDAVCKATNLALELLVSQENATKLLPALMGWKGS